VLHGHTRCVCSHSVHEFLCYRSLSGLAAATTAKSDVDAGQREAEGALLSASAVQSLDRWEDAHAQEPLALPAAPPAAAPPAKGGKAAKPADKAAKPAKG